MDQLRFLTVLVLFHKTLTFNVDIDHPVTFSGPQNSLFGYNSVLQTNRFVVTAPKGNQTTHPDLVSPGTVYRCLVNFNNRNGPTCDQVPVRTSDSPKYQSHQFLGGSVVKVNNGIVVCAHLAQSSQHTNIDYNIANGRCHMIDFAVSQVNASIRFPFDVFAMAGFSATAVKDGSYAVLGAPGFNNEGKGGFVTFGNPIRVHRAEAFSNINSFLHQSYIGYSVATGQFPILGDCVKSPLLLGTPRFASVEGHVGSVILLCETSSTVVILKQFFGQQIGSGFGYSILACDYNGDNIDDLIVSAPFFEHQRGYSDGGMVYVFLGTGDRDYLDPTNSTLVSDVVASGRFGTAMACLGDINADQLNDLAVSAPYDGNGVIYIYNGKRNMINTMYSQKIYGRNVDPGIRTFGLHIGQQSSDVDDNKYPDFTVGSALSAKLTLFRTRPVVSVTTLVTIQHQMIPLNSSGLGCEDPLTTTPCTTVTLCFSFTEHANGNVDDIALAFQVNVDVDRVNSRRQSRMHIVHNDTRYGDTYINHNYMLRKQQTHCESMSLRVTSFDRLFFAALDEPLKITMNYSLNGVSTTTKLPPVISSTSVTSEMKTVRFQTGCNGPCVPDLHVDMRIVPDVIVFGQSRELELTITLTNTGEPALAPVVRVLTSLNSSFVQTTDFQAGSVPVMCTLQSDNKTISCDCGNVLYPNQLAKFSLLFVITANSIISDDKNVTDIKDISVEASASVPGGQDANHGDNLVQSTVPVQLHSNVDLTGNSIPDQVTLSEDRTLISLEHKYELYNRGPSPMVAVSLSVNFPERFDNQRILNYNSFTISPDQNTTECDLTVRNQSTPDIGRVTTTPASQMALVAKDVTCDSDCVIVQCMVKDIDVDNFVTVSILFDVNTQNIDFKGISSLNYISHGSISSVPTELPFKLLNNGSTEVTSIIYPKKINIEEEVEPINLWIIVGGSIGGFVLLIILFVVMWKCGFFKRNKKKVVDEYKRKSNYYENRKTQRLEAARSKAMSKVMSRSDEIILHEA